MATVLAEEVIEVERAGNYRTKAKIGSAKAGL
jgi:hypothetical protein